MEPRTDYADSVAYLFNKETRETIPLGKIEQVNIEPTTVKGESDMSTYYVQMTREQVEKFMKMENIDCMPVIEPHDIRYKCAPNEDTTVYMEGHKERVYTNPYNKIPSHFQFTFVPDLKMRSHSQEIEECFERLKQRMASSPSIVETLLTKLKLEPKELIRNGNALIVYWSDGSKTVVKRKVDEPDDNYAAFAQALLKKMCGSTTHAHKIIDKRLKVQKPKEKKQTAVNEEDVDEDQIEMDIEHLLDNGGDCGV